MRRAARTDDNQVQLVTDLIRYGCTVRSLSAVGKGIPDLLVGYKGFNILFEVKNPNVRKSDQKLTYDQVSFHSSWKGQVSTIKSFDDAVLVLLALTHDQEKT